MVVFEKEQVSDRIIRIYGINGEQMYLILGEKQAALIDTGSGVGDLKGFVEGLTDLPVRVILTHGHVDHAMGAPQFEKVYLSPDDWALYDEQSPYEVRNAYLQSSPSFQKLTPEDYIPVRDHTFLRPIRDGQLFDLGGITIEAVLCPGHTMGSMMFLMRELDTLIAGDACTFFTMLQGDGCSGVYTYEKSLKAALLRVGGRYNRVLMSHSRLEAPVDLIEEVLEVCEEVRLGKDDHIPFTFLGTHGFVAKAYGNNGVSAYKRLDGKTGNLVYDETRIWY